MCAGIELKKPDDQRDSEIDRQVVLQHLSASYLNDEDGILTLVTDLCDRRHFYWYINIRKNKECHLMRYEASMTEARYLAHHMDDDASSSGTSAPEGFLNRASWKDVVGAMHLDYVTEGGAGDVMDVQDSSLDFMDDQDRREAVFQAFLKNSLPRMMYFPELAREPSSKGIPKDICVT